MSKRRDSIRGQGAEILFGAPPAVEMQPRNSCENSTNIRSLELESSVSQPLVALQTEADAQAPARSSESP